MPKRKLTPQQRKELSYDRDHRIARSAESVRAWRKSKKVKKRAAVHAARRKAKVAITKLEVQDSPDEAAGRRFTTMKQTKVYQWGLRSLRDVATRAAKRRQKT
jgi:hypothetical protein